MVYPDGNVWQRQQLELQVALGPEVPAALYHVDVKLGAVKAYSDELSAAYAGVNGAHRMKEALNIIELRAVDEQDVVPAVTETVRVAPVVQINEMSSGSIQTPIGGAAVFRMSGSVTDQLADITPGGAADITSVTIAGQSVPVTRSSDGGSDPWRPYKATYRFDAQVVLAMTAGDNPITVTAVNAVGAKGHASMSIRAEAHLGAERAIMVGGSFGDGITSPLSRLRITLPVVEWGTEPDDLQVGMHQADGSVLEVTVLRIAPGSYHVNESELGPITIGIPVPLYLSTKDRDVASFAIAMPSQGIIQADDVNLLETTAISQVFQGASTGGTDDGDDSVSIRPLEVNVMSTRVEQRTTARPERTLRFRYKNVMDEHPTTIKVAGRVMDLIPDPSDGSRFLTKDPVVVMPGSPAEAGGRVFGYANVDRGSLLLEVTPSGTAAAVRSRQFFASSGEAKDGETGNAASQIPPFTSERKRIPRGVKRIPVTISCALLAAMDDFKVTGNQSSVIDQENVIHFEAIDADGNTDGLVTIEAAHHKRGESFLRLWLSVKNTHQIGDSAAAQDEKSGLIGVKGWVNAPDIPLALTEQGFLLPGPKARFEVELNATWAVTDLHVVILAIDGGGYEAVRKAIADGAPNGFFARQYGTKAVQNGTVVDPGPAHNSLPTVTFTNWATWTTGQAPKDHGILGNAFFPRDLVGTAGGLGAMALR